MAAEPTARYSRGRGAGHPQRMQPRRLNLTGELVPKPRRTYAVPLLQSRHSNPEPHSSPQDYYTLVISNHTPDLAVHSYRPAHTAR